MCCLQYFYSPVFLFLPAQKLSPAVKAKPLPVLTVALAETSRSLMRTRAVLITILAVVAMLVLDIARMPLRVQELVRAIPSPALMDAPVAISRPIIQILVDLALIPAAVAMQAMVTVAATKIFGNKKGDPSKDRLFRFVLLIQNYFFFFKASLMN